VGLVWSYDPESYTGGSVATGGASHAGKVKGDDPDKKGYPGPQGWGLGVGLTTPPSKKLIVTNSQLREKPGEDNCRLKQRKQRTEMVFNIATWNIRTMFHPGKMQEISNEIIKYDIHITELQEIRWVEQGKIVKKDFTLFYSESALRTGIYDTGFIVQKKIMKYILGFVPKS
jgi:hypothetical protein